MHLRHKVIIVLFVITAVLVACGDNEHFKDLKVYISNLRTHKLWPKKSKTEETQLPDTITYRGAASRVPFAQTQEITPTNEVRQASNPLQAYPLSVLRFVGTIDRDNIVYAYIAAPDGIIHEVKQGDILGDHYGKVLSIAPEKMMVREQVIDAGRTKEHVVTLQLKEAH